MNFILIFPYISAAPLHVIMHDADISITQQAPRKHYNIHDKKKDLAAPKNILKSLLFLANVTFYNNFAIAYRLFVYTLRNTFNYR